MTTPDVGPRSGKVCVLYTGGTIGLKSSKATSPARGEMLSPLELAAALPSPSEIGVDFTFEPIGSKGSFEPVVSSQILPENWAQLAKAIEDNYDKYDGFVILHGTDTLAYTASALSFMFVNLAKPIVVTGSQRPITDVPSDAHTNFVNSVVLAARARDSIPVIPEVVICFGERVLRGNRAQKLSSVSWQGFESPNTSALGRVGRTFDIQLDRLRSAPAPRSKCYARKELANIVDVLMYPGMKGEQLNRAVGCAKGVVLRTFGAGNPPGDANMLVSIGRLVADGAVIVNVTQCNEGVVEEGMLTGSRRLADLGVVSGLDMTAEAAFTKLMVLLGNQPASVAAQQMQVNLRGEQSVNLVEFTRSLTSASEHGSYQIVLSESLPAHAQLDHLTSAVLLIRDIRPKEVTSELTHVKAFLNNWSADHAMGKADRRVLSGYPNGTEQTIVVDITDAARNFLEVGAPVTLTVVPDQPLARLEVVLSLFTDQAGISPV